MIEPIFYTVVIVTTIGLLAFVGAVSSAISAYEKEFKAAYRLLIISVVLVVCAYFLGFSSYLLKPVVAYINIVLLIIAGYLFLKRP
ncbi:MAG: hypothetical protein RBS81_03745, partial [Tenuifilaceae bacterium]|nr:hypothetical protein [Tenuifilaceae bacterium]